MYIERPLAEPILNCHSKVAILEGARAVGKTALVRNELEPKGFTYYSLTDPNTYEFAANNLMTWVNGLKLPAIIDEAQRLPDLPLAVKERVDQLSASGPQVILTGSASINRKGLEGQDPLARRSRRFTLHPLTRREIRRNGKSVVDDLWQGGIDPSYRTGISRNDLYDLMSLGGFPQYAVEAQFASARERYLSIRDDIDGVLGDTILPGEQLDKTIAHAVLRSLLCVPGGILNVSKMANELGFDSRTISRYIAIFERRYLIHAPPNLRLAARRQNVMHSKIHPVDTSFSCELLMESGRDPVGDPSAIGGLLESFVVNQLVASAQWSRHLPDAFYWRETGARPKEVDLVLVSGDELIGVEVKASDRISGSDFNGLKALSSDERFKRGFVLYTGGSVIQESENMWALPVSALWEEGAFMASEESNLGALTNPTAAPTAQRGDGQPADARLFLSYRHEDNDYLDGAIIRLADDIANEYRYQFASDLEVFVDSRSLAWGTEWQTALNSAVDATTFIMPAITPGYISSQACRSELQRFVSRGEDLVNGHILSVIWQDYHSTAAAAQNPSIVETIERYQYEDVSNLRDKDPKDSEYKARVRDLVGKIRRNVLEDLEKTPSANGEDPAVSAASNDKNAGLIEQMGVLDASMRKLQTSFGAALEDLDDIQRAMNDLPAPRQPNIATLQDWCSTLEHNTKEPVRSMRGNLAEARQSWVSVCRATKAYIHASTELDEMDGSPFDISDLRTKLVTTRSQFEAMGNIEQQAAPLRMLTVLSPRLHFLADGIFELVNTVSDMRSSLDDLIERADQAASPR